ncbi:MAG: 2Fe-2S iron-sulfur cluster binding domain-containing protein [Bacteroidetes bacterium]|nr:2Fe-2S iron-sulfur cluster binding domain-containing protein [Bacteroidota bacterium]
MSHTFHSLAVKQVTQETANTVTLTFAVPSELSEQFMFIQGQYLTLRFMLNGKEERRSYSMCSSPLEPGLSVTVKRVKGGKVSNYVFDKVKVGDVVDVMTPDGRFHTDLHDENKKNYYLIGAGSGITPLMSILKTILEKEPMSFVFLLYGSRNEDEIIFKNQLDELSRRYEGQLMVEHVLSQPKLEKAKGLGGLFSKGKPTWEGKIGRIDGKVFQKFYEENKPRHKQSEYFLCGPGGMIDAVEKSLLNSGIEKKNIHHEYFTASPSADASGASSTGEVIAGAKLTAYLDGRTYETTVAKGKHLLFAVIDAGGDAPYSCTSGACATCMAKVKKGTVKMDACYALDESEIKQGYILTCQAHPTSEEVEISFEV